MPTTSADDELSAGPDFCLRSGRLPGKDDGFSAVSGILVALTASLALWGLGVVIVVMLRSNP